MNELLKFTIIITIVVLTAFVLLQCVHTLSDNSKVLRELLQNSLDKVKSKVSSKGGNKDDN